MIELLEASPDGVPLLMVCTYCGTGAESVWRRPDDDPLGRTLPGWVRVHYRRRRYSDKCVTLVPGFPVSGSAPSGDGDRLAGANGHPPDSPVSLLVVSRRLRRDFTT